MYTNIEFLGTEPIENVITSMHFQMDRTIFFGYEEVIREYKKQTEDFLKKICGVKEVLFKAVSEKDLNDVLSAMRKVIENERAEGNKIFFDVTGGESLILVAFGMLAKEYEAPMHIYDVEADKLIELNPQDSVSIHESVKEKKVNLTLERFIKMRGAKINHDLDLHIIDTEDEVFMGYVRKLWPLMTKYKDNWNFYAGLLKKHFKPDGMYTIGTVYEDAVNDFAEFKSYMSDIAKTGVFESFRMEQLADGRKQKCIECSFYYKSLALKECLWKSGTVLELHVYEEMKHNVNDCDESVHIDWDGYIYGIPGKDVLNEIDVLCIKKNVPILISCKSGKMDGGQALQPLYELETVSNRFGGRYARKVLATLQPVTGVYADRAKEMGIELWCYGK